jgi:hypothetical protein
MAETAEAKPRVVLKCDAARLEPDLDGAVLSTPSVALLNVAARAETDFHVTGSPYAVSALLTDAPTELVVPLDTDGASLRIEDGVLVVPDRTSFNVTASRMGLGINGTVVNTMSAQSSSPLSDLLERGYKTIPLSYVNFGEFSAVLELGNIRFVNATTGEEFETVRFEEDADVDARMSAAGDVLESVYNQAGRTREKVVFAPAPSLTKSVMAVPFGVDGSGYDLASSVVSRPISLDREAFEQFAKQCIALEAGFDDSTMDRFYADCKRPGLLASRWCGAVANAMSTLVSMQTPYRVDGRAVMTPTGPVVTQTESWKAEASRTSACTADDCEGSGTHANAALHDAANVASDAALAADFPTIAAFANAMSLHYVGIGVLAANAGHAEDAGKHGKEAVAGHAIALAVPRSMVLKSMLIGLNTATKEREPSDGFVSDMTQAYSKAIFTDDEVSRMSPEDQVELRDLDGLPTLHDRLCCGDITPLAIEGTSPISPSILYSTNSEGRKHRAERARNSAKIAQKIGPSIARSINQLDVTPTDPDRHGFYQSFVEFLMSPSCPLMQSKELREKGFATSQLVFASPVDVTVAGATPKEIATGEFSFLSLWRLGKEDAETMDDALREVRLNTMPKREGMMRLDAHSSEGYKKSIDCLRSLNQASSTDRVNDDEHNVRFIVSQSALMNNQVAVETFCNKISGLGEGYVTRSRVVHMPDSIVDAEGEDVGHFVVVDVAAAVV